MDQYFQLRDDVGLTADGNQEPLRQIGVTLAVPIMREGEVVDDPHRYVIHASDTLKDGALARFIPGTRTVHAVDPRIADVLRQSGLFVQTDPPTKRDQQAQRSEARAAKQEAGTHKGDPDTTNPDPIVEG
jgi:hypothetical protein